MFWALAGSPQMRRMCSRDQRSQLSAMAGIAEQVRPKTKFPPPGGLVGQILAREEADIGVQQSTELSSFRGVDVVGLLPSEFQIVTEYAAAVPANALNPEGAKALIHFMRSAEGGTAMRAKGLVPK
jgi:molybdate transport system substrate-binding protein